MVATADEIGVGERKLVEIAGRSIGVFNLGGEFFALRNHCPHQGGALCEGRLWGVLEAERPGEYEYQPSREILACPWHGWEFHVRTGQSWCDPEKLRVRRYEVSVIDGGELEAPVAGRVEGPYVVETYPVKREGRFLVVEMPSSPRRSAD